MILLSAVSLLGSRVHTVAICMSHTTEPTNMNIFMHSLHLKNDISDLRLSIAGLGGDKVEAVITTD